MAAYRATSSRGTRVRTLFVPDHAARIDKLDEIRRLDESGVLIPRVAKTLPAAEASNAHRRFEAGVRGRLVLTF
ncbi:zinc-binding dehydrogenase [Plantactinospora sp. DSM 117369]